MTEVIQWPAIGGHPVVHPRFQNQQPTLAHSRGATQQFSCVLSVCDFPSLRLPVRHVAQQGPKLLEVRSWNPGGEVFGVGSKRSKMIIPRIESRFRLAILLLGQMGHRHRHGLQIEGRCRG